MPRGRTHEWPVGSEDAGARLDKFLAAADRLASRGRAAAALSSGKVFLNDSEAGPADAATRLTDGDVVGLWADRPGSARRTSPRRTGDLEIVFEDDVLLVINKPPGLLSVPLERKAGASSVYDQLEQYFRPRGKRRPFVVHRIDRDTSGLVLFAKDSRTQAALKAQFKRREPERVYLAVVRGHPAPPHGTWRDRLVWDKKALLQKEARPKDPDGVEAISDYRVLETFSDTALVEVRLRTGKRNQIRLQARLRGHALVGEQRYVGDEDTADRPSIRRQALHAHRLGFRHPLDDRAMSFEAPLPDDFQRLLKRLRRQSITR